ncbi:MAG: extracellular solute-binding protein [Candidatus Altiarchaeota archaeon]
MQGDVGLSRVIIVFCLILVASIGLFYVFRDDVLGKPGKTIVKVQMFEGPESEAMIPTVEYWNEHYSDETGILVETEAMERVGYFDKLEIQLMSGMPEPDIIHPFSIHLGRLKDELEPLDKYLEDDEVMTAPDGKRLSLDSMLDIALKTVESPDGKTYMLPKDMSEVILYYRKDLIPKPPETWEEYVEVSKMHTRSLNKSSPTEYGTVMQGKYEMWTFCAALENLWPYGTSIFKPGTSTPNFDNEDTVRGLRVFEELSEANAFPPESINAEHPEVAAIVQEGEVAMAMQWNAFYQDLVNEKKSPKVYDKFDIAPPPGVRQADGSVRRDMYVQTIGLAINKNSRNKKAAARFLAWATLGEGAEIYARGRDPLPGGSSPVKSVWSDDHILDLYPKILPWVEEYGRTTPVHEDITDLMMIGSSWIQRVMAGDVTAEEASRGLNRDIADYMEKEVGG